MHPTVRNVVVLGEAAFTPLSLFANGVALIGDSRITDYQWWKNVSSADWKGLPLSGLGLPNPGITADSSGTLEYTAADHTLRWTAPSDTAGPWTPMVAGIVTLQSGSANKGVILGIRDMTTLPGTDQSVSVLISGSVQYNWRSYTFWNRAFNIMRWPNTAPAILGIGGNTTAQVVEQLPFINAQAAGGGYDIYHLSTNDISGGVSSATIIANLTAIYDARRALGRKGVLVGEPARWGVNTSTPLTAGQITIFDAVNAFMVSYAATYGWTYIDTFTLTYDSGQTDRRPAAGMLRDTVHYSERGAQIVGQAIASTLMALGIRGPQRADGDSGNQMSLGYFSGSGGTNGTGASGSAPTGTLAARVIGSDATMVSSLVARTDGIAGNWWQMVCAATASGQVLQANASAAGTLLAALGLAVGDRFYLEGEYEISGVTAGRNVDFYIDFEGTSPAHSLHASLDSGSTAVIAAEAGKFRTGIVAVPVGATRARPFMWIRPGASSLMTIRTASWAIVKVP